MAVCTIVRKVVSRASSDVTTSMASTKPSSRSRPSTICAMRSWTSASSSRSRSCDNVSRKGCMPPTRPTASDTQPWWHPARLFASLSFRPARGFQLGAEDRRLGPPLHSELGQQPRDIIFDGLLGKKHARGDLLIRQPFTEQPEQCPLLIGEPNQWIGPFGSAAKLRHQCRGSPIVQQRFTGTDVFDGPSQLHALDVFDDVSAGAGQYRVEHRLIGGERGQ